MPAGSWKTGILGYIVIALDVLQFIAQAVEKQGIPTSFQGWITTLGGLAGGIGLLVAKDFNVSNAPQPAAPTVVSAAAMVKPNPSAIVKPVLLVLAMLVAGTLTACSALPSFLGGSIENQITTLVNAYADGTYVVSISKDGKVLYAETVTCVAKGAGQLPVCHLVNSQTLSVDVVPAVRPIVTPPVAPVK